MRFDQWIQWAERYWKANPQLRWGQALFNSLATWRPNLAESIRGKAIDPFHVDSAVPVFLKEVKDRWYEPVDLSLKPFAGHVDAPLPSGTRLFMENEEVAEKVRRSLVAAYEEFAQAVGNFAKVRNGASAEWWAVLDLHRPIRGDFGTVCNECRTDMGVKSSWPCATFEAIR